MELESQSFEVLKRLGISRGQIVLDFGCGSGTYAVVATKIVSQQGRLYALDKDRKALVVARRSIRRRQYEQGNRDNRPEF